MLGFISFIRDVTLKSMAVEVFTCCPCYYSSQCDELLSYCSDCLIHRCQDILHEMNDCYGSPLTSDPEVLALEARLQGTVSDLGNKLMKVTPQNYLRQTSVLM